LSPNALVTGAGRRVGRAIALDLAGAGFNIAVHCHRSEDAAEAVAAACRELGVEAFVVQADLSSAEGCRSLSNAVAAQWGSLDVLVNNASLFEPCAFESIDDQAWQEVMDVNLLAPARLSRDLLPLLRAPSDGGAAGACGVIVHLCDIGAERPLSGYAHYSVSKAGLVMLVKAMAVELAPDVRTVGVSPGQVAWPEDYDAATRERLTARVPMGRVGTVEEVASLVRVLVTESTYLNGVVVPIDGGLSCRY